MEDSRNMTRFAGKLLVNAQELVGRRPNTQERDEMRDRRNGMQQTVTSLQNAIQSSGYLPFFFSFLHYYFFSLN